jgi:hypothetical protein
MEVVVEGAGAKKIKQDLWDLGEGCVDDGGLLD